MWPVRQGRLVPAMFGWEGEIRCGRGWQRVAWLGWEMRRGQARQPG